MVVQKCCGCCFYSKFKDIEQDGDALTCMVYPEQRPTIHDDVCKYWEFDTGLFEGSRDDTHMLKTRLERVYKDLENEKKKYRSMVRDKNKEIKQLQSK